MLSSVAAWLDANESVISALAALAALMGVTYAMIRLMLTPWREKKAAARSRQADAARPDDVLAAASDKSLASATPHHLDVMDDHVSVAVLSFEVLSGNEGDKYIAAGIASEIVSLITPIADLRVSARSTIYGWKADDVTARQAAEQINAKFALIGSLRIDGKRMRVIANLTEMKTDSHIWTGTYDKVIEDLFEVQYDIARSIVGAILGQVRLAESQLAHKLPTQQLDAWGLLQKAYYFWLTNFTIENVQTATDYLQKAITLDPGYAAPKAALAMLLSQLTTSGVCDNPNAVRATVAELAEEAYGLAPNDASVLESLGVAWQNIGEGQRAVKALRRAIEMTPLNLICRGYLAMTQSFVGGPQGATEAKLILTENFSIAPKHPVGSWWYWFLAIAEQALGQYEASRDHCEKSLMGQQGWVHTYYFLANALFELGEDRDAKVHLATAAKVNPIYSVALYVENLRLISGSDELARPFYSGFVKAGLAQIAA